MRATALPQKPALRLIRLLHTLAWAFFAGCIVLMPVAALQRRFDIALILACCVLVECGVLLLNRMRCPLTDVAARYTTDGRANFDIYLPLLVARHNKTIFGGLFAFNLLFTYVLWRRWL
jgi:hypothetical protein